MLNLTVINQSSKLFVVPHYYLETKAMRGEYEFEPDASELEEPESQDILDKVEADMYDLSGTDEKLVKDILKIASSNFDKKPGKWRPLLEEVKKAIENNRKGDFEDDEEGFTALLQDKLTEANELVEQ